MSSIGIVFFIVISNSCSYKTLPIAKVNYISSKEGTIIMRANGIGINYEDAINDAEKNSMNVLLFRGLPESGQEVPLIGTNENEEKNMYKNYFNDFFNNSRYKTFIMSSIPTTKLIKNKNSKKSFAVDIKVNISALRRDLEQNQIIRKFGL